MSRALRRATGVAASTAVWIATQTGVLACPVCFQVEEGPVVSGVRAAVVVLVGVTVSVLAGFGVFIAKFVRRSAGTAEAETP